MRSTQSKSAQTMTFQHLHQHMKSWRFESGFILRKQMQLDFIYFYLFIYFLINFEYIRQTKEK